MRGPYVIVITQYFHVLPSVYALTNKLFSPGFRPLVYIGFRSNSKGRGLLDRINQYWKINARKSSNGALSDVSAACKLAIKCGWRVANAAPLMFLPRPTPATTICPVYMRAFVRLVESMLATLLWAWDLSPFEDGKHAKRYPWGNTDLGWSGLCTHDRLDESILPQSPGPDYTKPATEDFKKYIKYLKGTKTSEEAKSNVHLFEAWRAQKNTSIQRNLLNGRVTTNPLIQDLFGSTAIPASLVTTLASLLTAPAAPPTPALPTPALPTPASTFKRPADDDEDGDEDDYGQIPHKVAKTSSSFTTTHAKQQKQKQTDIKSFFSPQAADELQSHVC